jgi:hypothetical protein
MRNAGLLLGIVLVGALTVGSLAGRDTSARPENVSRWEYGILRMNRLTWSRPGVLVDHKNGPDFAASLNALYSSDSDVFEINILSSRGDQGWELVAMPAGATYVFKRPR